MPDGNCSWVRITTAASTEGRGTRRRAGCTGARRSSTKHGCRRSGHWARACRPSGTYWSSPLRRGENEIVHHSGERPVPCGAGTLTFCAAATDRHALQKRRHHCVVAVVLQGRLYVVDESPGLDSGGKDPAGERVDAAARPPITCRPPVRRPQHLRRRLRTRVAASHLGGRRRHQCPNQHGEGHRVGPHRP